MGVDFKSKVLGIEGERVKLQVRPFGLAAHMHACNGLWRGGAGALCTVRPRPRPFIARGAPHHSTALHNRPLTQPQVWDTAGQERFRTISISFLRGAQGIALVFALNDRKSFDNVRQWMKQVRDNTDGDISMVLLANKADLESERVVSEDEISEISKTLGVEVFYTSAKANVNVSEAFTSLATLATKRVLETKAKSAVTAEATLDLKKGADAGAAAGGGCC